MSCKDVYDEIRSENDNGRGLQLIENNSNVMVEFYELFRIF